MIAASVMGDGAFREALSEAPLGVRIQDFGRQERTGSAALRDFMAASGRVCATGLRRGILGFAALRKVTENGLEEVFGMTGPCHAKQAKKAGKR